METQVILLGTGTPNACYNASGPATAIIINNKAYIVDFGPGIIRQCTKAYHQGINALRPDLLTVAFCTHLHSDHTAGFSDLILTPWVLERNQPLEVYGPKGITSMSQHILEAYKVDIDFRINGFEKANTQGYLVNTHEISEGIIYTDEYVSVEAFSVSHGTLECYAYKFTTTDNQTIVISGDTCPLDSMAQKAKDVDLLLHEVEYSAGLKNRLPKWQKYHQEVHTLSTDLAQIAMKAQPKLLVTYHRIYHMDMLDNTINIEEEMNRRDELILEEIKNAGYTGIVVNGKDMDKFTLKPQR
ncbi:MAG: MBL fold metallo-hydrolase [Erysipelotrichaceae bacterium]|nr:MBL fold metallo-hydrolase [Erysipelotrichaceae bacterium]